MWSIVGSVIRSSRGVVYEGAALLAFIGYMRRILQDVFDEIALAITWPFRVVYERPGCNYLFRGRVLQYTMGYCN